MNVRHAAVWIDHHEAKVFHVDEKGEEAVKIHAPNHHIHRHPVTTAEHDHPTDTKHFFHGVAGALEGAQEILVVGPGTAKLEFLKHVHKHEHRLEPRIVAVETVDHPTEGQLVAFVRRYFVAADRMLGKR